MQAPLLEGTIDRLLARERRRRRDASIRRALAAVALAAIVLALWRIHDRFSLREPMPFDAALTLLALVAGVGAFFVVRAATNRSDLEIARELDLRLGLDDRASAAFALVRGGAASRLDAFVVADAERALTSASGRIDVLFPSKPEPRATATTKRLFYVALVLAGVAALLELNAPWWGLRPSLVPGESDRGPVAEKSSDKPPPGAPGAEPGKPDAPKNDEAKKPEKRDAESKKTPPPPKPDGDVRVAMRTSKEEYDANEAVAAVVTATPLGSPRGAARFDVRIKVDDDEFGSGVQVEIDPRSGRGDSAELDVRRLPGMDLKPGEHVAQARLITRDSHEEHVSPPVKFRVREPKKKDDDKGPDKPKQKPRPQEAPPPSTAPRPPEKKDDGPTGAAPLPPVQTEKKVVVPLFREGEEVKKHGLTLVLDPGGGADAPAKKRPLDAALPAAKRRAEEAVDAGGVRDEDRALVRRYFELLEGLSK